MNSAHLQKLHKGRIAWNEWRKNCPEINPDLQAAPLKHFDLRGINLTKASLERANLREALLSGADLSGANLRFADLRAASLRRAILDNADLTGASLRHVSLIKARVKNAVFTGCEVFGISAWDLIGEPGDQSNLTIRSKRGEPVLTVDEIEVAHFIYLLVRNEQIRKVIDTVTSKAVLILGRFTPERKAVIDAIREELRDLRYLPIVFDFDKPSSKDVTGTVEMLARMARFIIADFTDPSSIPHELATIVPFLRTTPVLPLRLVGSRGCSMFDDLRSYRWVLDTHEYQNSASLIASLSEVIAPANAMVEELRR